MSRIGKMPITIPSGVEVKIADGKALVKGSKGELSFALPPLSKVEVDGTQVIVTRSSDDKADKSQHGLTRSLLNNAVVGVTEGFKKTLEVNGVGFKVALDGQTLVLSLGFSHDIRYNVPKDVNISVEKMQINVEGIDRQRVGQVAAEIRDFKKPEPYKGKGIKYSDEHIVRKAGKSGK